MRKKDKNDLTGLTALVTGGAGGIGLEFAKVLASYGCKLILLDISKERLQDALGSLKSDYGTVHLSLNLDLTSDSFISQIDEFCSKNSIFPDILINNAGIFSFKPIPDTETRKIETFIDLHVRAVTLLSQWFVSKRKPLGSGYMLNMSSMSCWMPMPGLAMYSSTKSYIRVFSRALHYEMKEYGVGVTVACPGGIATDLFGLPKKWQKFAVSIGVLQTPEKFARKAVKKMMRKKKQYINGWLNRFSIFFVGILPTSVRMMVKHHLLDKGITR
ncbi:MAG: SDR family NAD(P)-dependent oxidoreductase [Muribaculaceae bacterium]|nr:SDR family NAD(P)-dependent oxidoreductase [Muribaculaceae bacterium]